MQLAFDKRIIDVIRSFPHLPPIFRMRHDGDAAGAVYKRECLFLRRTPAFDETARLSRRIVKQIFVERLYYRPCATMVDEPSREMRTRQYIAAGILLQFAIINFNADTPEILQYPFVSLIALSDDFAEERLQFFVFAVDPKRQQMKAVEVFARFD